MLSESCLPIGLLQVFCEESNKKAQGQQIHPFLCCPNSNLEEEEDIFLRLRVTKFRHINLLSYTGKADIVNWGYSVQILEHSNIAIKFCLLLSTTGWQESLSIRGSQVPELLPFSPFRLACMMPSEIEYCQAALRQTELPSRQLGEKYSESGTCVPAPCTKTTMKLLSLLELFFYSQTQLKFHAPRCKIQPSRMTKRNGKRADRRMMVAG